ncbi:MAG: hypothetical protein M0Z54_09930 [Thermaerobacter sp.]|nr:hypothetical protein [Thermaerobacter sp.]
MGGCGGAADGTGRQEQDAVRHAVVDLAAHQREARTMVYREGLSGQAVLRQRVPLGILKTCWRLGLAKLRDVPGAESDAS